MSSCSTIVNAGLGNLFVGKFGISPFTITFILSVWIWLLGAQHFGYFDIDGNIMEPALGVNPKEYQKPSFIEYDLVMVMNGILKGVA